jgi:hypothetical protein
MSKINNNNIYMKYFLIPLFAVLLFGSCRKSNTATTPEAQEETQTTQITGEMAFEGVNSYCHSNYDWSIAEENPEIMYVAMGDESETEYKVIFRSYTGSFVHFYVDKASGNTRMVEVVPSLDIVNEVGTFNLFDYLDI